MAAPSLEQSQAGLSGGGAGSGPSPITCPDKDQLWLEPLCQWNFSLGYFLPQLLAFPPLSSSPCHSFFSSDCSE